MTGAPPGSALAAAFHGLSRLATRRFGGRWAQVDPGGVPEPERLEVARDGVTLSCLRWRGPGPRLVLLHGLNGNAWFWARVAARLRDVRDVVAISLRGHGRSTAPASGYDLATVAGDVLAVAEALGPGPFDLAGQSWGGKVALVAAATAPGRVRTLTLADPVPPRGLHPLMAAFPRLIERLFTPERGPFATRAAMEAATRTVAWAAVWDGTDRRLLDEAFRQAPDGLWHHALPDAAFREILTGSIAEDASAHAARVRCPVLLMLPSLSLSLSRRELRPILDLPGVRVERVEGDHTFNHSNPLDTADAMRRFLDG